MKIGIDARLIGETGVGRYIRNLLVELDRIDRINHYVLFLPKRAFHSFVLPNGRWEKRMVDVPWHSLREQLVLPFLWMRERVDLVHVPYFNAPIFYPGKFLLTIHDLTILHVDTGKASTLPYVLYKIRRLGYRCILAIAIRRCAHIVAVSETVKKDIIDRFRVASDRITVTHEGLDRAFQKRPRRSPAAAGDFFLYVGNVYPHKNVEALLAGYARYVRNVKDPARLLFVGPSDYFSRRLKELVISLGLGARVKILTGLTDRELRTLYTRARALVFPSRMEGFGLPAIEALSQGTPVICSDIPIFHEILGPYAHYVDTTKAQHISFALQRPYVRKNDKKLASFLARYSWADMAKKTLAIYEYCVRV